MPAIFVSTGSSAATSFVITGGFACDFIHAWRGQSGKGFVPHSGAAADPEAAAVAEPPSLAAGLSAVADAAAVAEAAAVESVAGSAEALAAALAVADGVAEAVAVADGVVDAGGSLFVHAAAAATTRSTEESTVRGASMGREVTSKGR